MTQMRWSDSADGSLPVQLEQLTWYCEGHSRWGTFISVCDQPPRSTQPGLSFVWKAQWVPAKERWRFAAGE